MSEFAEAVDALIEAAREKQFTDDDKYDLADLDDYRLRPRILRIAQSRQPTVADLDQAIAEVEAEAKASLKKSIEFSIACNERRDDLHVFYVYNTAGRKLTVLAKDAACARYYAHTRGHIQDRKNGRVMVMKEANELELRQSGQALGRALRDGYPGIVKKVGDNVVNEGRSKVYTPMTIVE